MGVSGGRLLRRIGGVARPERRMRRTGRVHRWSLLRDAEHRHAADSLASQAIEQTVVVAVGEQSSSTASRARRSASQLERSKRPVRRRDPPLARALNRPEPARRLDAGARGHAPYFAPAPTLLRYSARPPETPHCSARLRRSGPQGRAPADCHRRSSVRSGIHRLYKRARVFGGCRTNGRAGEKSAVKKKRQSVRPAQRTHGLLFVRASSRRARPTGATASDPARVVVERP